jgi:hypothetical protein
MYFPLHVTNCGGGFETHMCHGFFVDQVKFKRRALPAKYFF